MHKKLDKLRAQRQQYLLKRVAWINIIAQFSFPLAGAFMFTSASAETHTASQYFPSTATTTDPDSLKQGKTATKLVSETKADDAERNLANIATRAGEILSGDSSGSSAINQLGHLAVGKANQQLQNWLGHYGTARVQTNIDRHGHLDGSQLDMLLPLYDSLHTIDFTQFGIRRIDKRNTLNIGLGQRRFFDGWMLGYNAFWDYDMTGRNSRLGLGAEYARDYLKLGLNGYFRLSNWKESRLLKDYDERPANGFDVRAQGYIPALPQLGGELVYEQYFGNEVGLINQNRRSQNPAAFTAGINYTPVPLLTFGLDRKQETSGRGETLFNMEVNYQFGTPWSKQIDPDAVAFRRTLQGSRYDLVERNNQIVLEYRKREVIRLTMDKLISGYGGETKSIHLSVNSKYGLKNIEWDAENLRVSGGKITRKNDNTYVLTLPKYYPHGKNAYTIGAVAYDQHGNASKRVEAQVQVLQEPASADKSTFTAKDHELSADGHSSTVLTLTLIGEDGKPIIGAADDIKFLTHGLEGEGSAPKIDPAKETQPGVYKASLTAGVKVGVLTVTPEVKGLDIKSVEITFFHPDKPIVSDLVISGKLEMGYVLSATYTFNANHGENVDKSRYLWGNKGNVDIAKGSTIVESGKIPDYKLTLEDAGKVKALTVQAQNGLHITGNTKTVDTSMSQMQGNNTKEGTPGGKVKGIADKFEITVNTAKVKKGETITLNVKTFNHGKPVNNVPIEVKAINAINRQGASQTATVQIDDTPIHYQGFTGDQALSALSVTDPNGLGVNTTLQVNAYGVSAPKTKDVIFTVATSPDTPEANFWGHMDNTVTTSDGTFTRPSLLNEIRAERRHGLSIHKENNEIWVRFAYASANKYCRNHGKLVPSREQLLKLYEEHQNNVMNDEHGWPKERSYRSSTFAGDRKDEYGHPGGHFTVNIDDANKLDHVIADATADYVTCYY
ncbi:MAG: inverse autotransporter beta domain-containing protein [Enterobacteriaceae bacterium]|jgi:adhesin/invasin|nr:inverse autotransporter beta domain-containing protein [Enterobacteriaceae bacterium]